MVEVTLPAFVGLILRRLVAGDNLEDEQPACLSLGWLKENQVEGQQAVWWWTRPLLPLIST